MNEKQLQELLTHVAKTYGVTAMISLWIAFDTETPNATEEYGTKAMQYFRTTCESLQKVDR